VSNQPRALFVGLCTLDIIQSVDHVPGPNDKITALRQTIAGGGPATNAAVTYAYLGGISTLLTAVGQHPLASGIRADLTRARVDLADLSARSQEPPALSSVLVTAGSGERAVVSVNASHQNFSAPDDLAQLVEDCALVAADGHHPGVAEAALRIARENGKITFLDGGSWKSGTGRLLADCDVVVCSSDFHPPGTDTPGQVLAFLHEHGVKWAAITNGSNPVIWRDRSGVHSLEVPGVHVVDTLAAGDVFHGALAWMLAAQAQTDDGSFRRALAFAAHVAAASCRHFGSREWMKRPPDVTIQRARARQAGPRGEPA
jgi:sugar/nucleoside kinase (ribokinase family)